MLLRLFVSVAITLSAAPMLTSCGPTETLTVTNDCGHAVKAWAGVAVGEAVADEVDTANDRYQYHSRDYVDGATETINIGPTSSATAMVIVYGMDTAYVDFFGEGRTGTNEYTISGDMCLLPADEG